MGLLQKAAEWVVRKSGLSPDQWFAEFGGLSRSAGNIAVTQLSAMQVTTVMACVSILSEDIAKLPVHVYQKRADGGRDIVKGHPVERLLQRPNDYQTKFEFFEQMQGALLLRGNAYAAIIRDSRGRPVKLIPINPDRVWIYEAQDGSYFYQVARHGLHDMAMLSSLPLMIAAEDMLHLRWMSIANSLWGSSRIGLGREAIALAISQQELAERLSANNTNLGGVLQTDQKLTKEAAERLANDWKTRKSGLINAGSVAVLEQGLKWEQLGMTAQEAEVIAARGLQVEEIARMFRMPLHKLGVANRSMAASIEQMDQDYVNNTVSSHLSRWEDKLNTDFGLLEDDVFVWFDVSQFLRASIQVRYLSYRTGIVGMFLTPNEARRAEGLPDVEGGDKLYQPTNVAEIGFEPAGRETGPGSDVTGHAAPGGRGDPAAPDDASPTG